MKAIEIRDLKYKYRDGTLALKNISLDIEKGKKLAILGSNGSGKSTLLQHLNGLLLPQEGSIKIDGIEVDKKNISKIRKKIGFVFDNPDNQLFATTVFEDIAFGPRNLKIEEIDVFKNVNKALNMIGIEDLKEKQPHNLSLGQKRKVAIAGVLCMNPDILIFDEPFSGLDPQSLDQFLDILNMLYEIGKSLIVTTHNVDIAYSWAEKIAIIKDGEIISYGDVSVLENEEILNKANLNLPTLYSIFKDTDIQVRNIDKAKNIIDKNFKKCGGKFDE